jgi:thiol-disulfide isomerase/thioredoxin
MATSRPVATHRPPWLWVAVGAAVVLAGVAALAAGRSHDSPKPTTRVPAGSQATRPVRVTGAPLPTLPDSGKDPAVGKPIPELHGATFAGKPLAITRDGRPKLVLFVAHWCPHCQREIPLLGPYLARHPLPSGVELVTVSTGVNQAYGNYPPAAWLAGKGWKAPTMADSTDSDAARAFGLSAYPFYVVVDAKGSVVTRTSGEMTTSTFAALARSALA